MYKYSKFRPPSAFYEYLTKVVIAAHLTNTAHPPPPPPPPQKKRIVVLYPEYLRIGLSFVIIFTTLTESHFQLINYLCLHIELTPMEKAQLLHIGLLSSAIKCKTF